MRIVRNHFMMPGGKNVRKTRTTDSAEWGTESYRVPRFKDVYRRIAGGSEQKGGHGRCKPEITRHQGVDEDHNRKIGSQEMQRKRQQAADELQMWRELKDVRGGEVERNADAQYNNDHQRVIFPVGGLQWQKPWSAKMR